MPPIYITFLNRLDIEELALSDEEILAAIETSLAAQGRGQTVIEPRVHLAPGQSNGHFNVLRGAINAPVDRAGIKVVGDFVDNYKLGFPSELGVVLLLDPRTGAPQAILDGAGITDMRTGAMTAVGAKYLARKDSKILGHIGARGSAYWNVRLLDHLFDFDEISRPFQAAGKPQRLRRTLGARPRQEGHGDRRLALLRRRRRYRRRGVAADGAGAAPEDRVDQACGVHRPLRHDERRRAVAH